MFVCTSICPYYYILTYLFCVTVIHLLCYFMLCAFVTYSIKLRLLLGLLLPYIMHLTICDVTLAPLSLQSDSSSKCYADLTVMHSQ